MKLLVLLLLCAPVHAATLTSLELLRGIAADQGVVLQDIPTPPKARAQPVAQDYSGTVRVVAKSPDWRRPKEALKDRSLVLENAEDAAPSGKQWAWLKDSSIARALAPGSRAWIRGRFAPKEQWRLTERMLDVSQVIALPSAPARQIAAKAQNEELGVALAQVFAWCDHQPTFGAAGRRQYLVVTTTLSNKTDKPLEVKLTRAFLSFAADSEGFPVDGLTLRGANGRSSGQAAVTLAPGENRRLDWRGDGLFPENAHDKTLYVTLSLSSGSRTLFVRGSGAVLMTQ